MSQVLVIVLVLASLVLVLVLVLVRLVIVLVLVLACPVLVKQLSVRKIGTMKTLQWSGQETRLRDEALEEGGEYGAESLN